jgi:hypothetical protein
MDPNWATGLTDEVALCVDDMFTYRPWDQHQTAAGHNVRIALANAVKVIIANVPPCQDRSSAIRKLREAAWTANSAITHGGKI